MATDPSAKDLLQVIPPPCEIRTRLGLAVREADILRRQLKVSEAAVKAAIVEQGAADA